MTYETFGVSRGDREPLVRWMVEALEGVGCRLLFVSDPTRAPFWLTFETRMGERMGVIAYAFLAQRWRGRCRAHFRERSAGVPPYPEAGSGRQLDATGP